MSLPPLANLFAVYDEDPRSLETLRQSLQFSEEFSEVWTPAPGWVAAAAPLPGGTPDNEAVRCHGLAFAEGRGIVLDDIVGDPEERLREIASLADNAPEKLATLPGDFGFVRFRAHGRATVVRSCGGLVPFYIGRIQQRLVVSTTLTAIIRHLSSDLPRLDPLVNALWAVSLPLFPEGRTFFEGISIVPRGHFVRIEAGAPVAMQRYWYPRPAAVRLPTPGQAREHAEHLRRLLLRHLERELDPEGGNLLALSGGVDSSSLAALAAGHLGRPVWTLSLLPPKERVASLAHERSYIESLAERYGFARRWELFYRPTLIPDIWPAAPKVAFHVLHPVLCSLPAIVREAPVRVLFGGEYADNVVGSPGFTGPDWARHTPPAYFLAHPEVLFKAPHNLALYAKHRLARLLGRPVMPFPEDRLDTDPLTGKPLEMFRPELAEEYRAWWQAQRRALREDNGPWAWLWLESLHTDSWVPMNWEACSALGVRRSIPFFTREVFELVFACHPTELYGPGPKKLLRAALKGHVPERNLFRPDKGGFAAYARQVQRAWQGPGPEDLPEDLAPLLRPQWLERPPETVGYFQHRALTRLLIFLEAVNYNWQGKGSPADTPPVDLPLESITHQSRR